MAFAYYSPVTVQSGQVPSTQTDFPVLVSYTDARLKTVGNGGHVQNANGYDIRPYSNTGLTSAMTYELEYYNASTGQVVMWVKVSSLAVGSVVYLAYGDAALNTNGSSASTWDSNYKLVAHVPNGTTLSVADSTGTNTGSISGATAGTGKIDGGADLTTSQYINYPSDTSLDGTTGTWSGWVKTTSASSVNSLFSRSSSGGSAGGINIFMTGAGLSGYQIHLAGGGVYLLFQSVSPAINDGNWHYIVLVFGVTGQNTIYYVDGTSINSQLGSGGNWSFNANALRLGASLDTFWQSWRGSQDEFRVSNIQRSANWITTEYNNQSAPSTFATLGTEVPINTGTTRTFGSIMG